MNLVINARDAMPNGGTLDIETSVVQYHGDISRRSPEARVGRYVVVTVSDTGCGMDENTRSQIFEPFFTTKEVGKGTGLGLSTVYGIVNQGDGFIDVTSELGVGTTFKLYFPIVDESSQQVLLQVDDTRLPRGAEVVLVVEDEHLLREITVTLLQESGYRVLEAKDADEALAVLATTDMTVDLLLTDVVMPGRSGAELARDLREKYPNLRTVFMSGYTGDLVARQGLQLDEASLLNKPFSRKSLLAKVYFALHPPSD
jgi:hypothetical protein